MIGAAIGRVRLMEETVYLQSFSPAARTVLCTAATCRPLGIVTDLVTWLLLG